MANWMTSWAKGSWSGRGQAETGDLAFELTCECGQRHEGMRRRRYQQILCKDCGSLLFVLPANTYPPPPEKRKKKPTEQRRRDRQQAEAAARGETLSDSMMEMPAYAADRLESVWHRTGQRLRQDAALKADQFAAWSRRRAVATKDWFTKTKLIVLGLVAVMIAAGLWQLRSASRQAAERQFLEQGPAGFEAFAAGDVAEAAQLFALARDGVDTLGLDTPEADAVRIAAREAEALAKLSFQSLPEVIEDLPPGSFRGGVWTDAVRRRVGSAWFVWEGPVVKNRLPLPIRIDGRKVILDVSNLPVIQRLPDEADIVVLAVQMDTLERTEDAYRVRFRPDTAFLWHSLATYERLGIPFEFGHERGRVKQLLKTQRSWTGAAADPFARPVDALDDDEEFAGDGFGDEPGDAAADALLTGEATDVIDDDANDDTNDDANDDTNDDGADE